MTIDGLQNSQMCFMSVNESEEKWQSGLFELLFKKITFLSFLEELVVNGHKVNDVYMSMTISEASWRKLPLLICCAS